MKVREPSFLLLVLMSISRSVFSQNIHVVGRDEIVLTEDGSMTEYTGPRGKFDEFVVPDGLGISVVREWAFGANTYPADTISAHKLRFEARVDSILFCVFTECLFDSIYIAEGVRYMGEDVFAAGQYMRSRKRIRELKLPDTLGKFECIFICDIKELRMPTNLKELGGGFFSSGVERVELNEKLEIIGRDAFYHNEIKELSIPSSVRVMGGFRSNEIEALDVPGTVEMIDTLAFEDNPLRKLELHDGLREIKKKAFANCFKKVAGEEAYGSVSFPSTLERLEYGAFGGCPGLRHVEFNEGLREIGAEAFARSGLEKAEMPETVESIGKAAFKESKNLKSVSLTNELKKLGREAFMWCDLEEIEIPGSITEVADSAFLGNWHVKKIRVSEGISKIGGYALSFCYETEEVRLPSTLRYIGANAFYSTSFPETKLPTPPVGMVWKSFDGTPDKVVETVTTIGGNRSGQTKYGTYGYALYPDGKTAGAVEREVDVEETVATYDMRGRRVRDEERARGVVVEVKKDGRVAKRWR